MSPKVEIPWPDKWDIMGLLLAFFLFLLGFGEFSVYKLYPGADRIVRFTGSFLFVWIIIYNTRPHRTPVWFIPAIIGLLFALLPIRPGDTPSALSAATPTAPVVVIVPSPVSPTSRPTNAPTRVVAPTNTRPPVPTPTRALLSLGRITLQGASEEGFKFVAPQDGQYIFKYSSGVYSPFPNADPGRPQWRTGVSVYLNRPIVWVQRQRNPEDSSSITYREPGQSDDYFSTYVKGVTRAEATALAQAAPSLQFGLRKGEYLIFVATDDQGWYVNPAPNVGEVIFDVQLLPK